MNGPNTVHSNQLLNIWLQDKNITSKPCIKREVRGDHMEVGWQLPNGVFERPVPGNRLSPFTAVAVCAASIQPNSSITFCSGGNVTLNSNTGPNYAYQWIKDNVNINGATTYSYNTGLSGNYEVRISYPGCTAWSAPTKVTVNTTLSSQITLGGSTTFCSGGNDDIIRKYL